MWHSCTIKWTLSVQTEGTTELMLSLNWYQHFSLSFFSYELVPAKCKVVWGFQKLLTWATRSLLYHCHEFYIDSYSASFLNTKQTCCCSEPLHPMNLTVSLKPRPMPLVNFYECCSLESHLTHFSFLSPHFQSVIKFWWFYLQNIFRIWKIFTHPHCSNPDSRTGYSLIDTISLLTAVSVLSLPFISSQNCR